MSHETPIARPPSRGQLLADAAFRRLSQLSAALVLAVVAFIVLRIAFAAAPAVREHGLDFLTGRVWDPNKGRYAILPEIWGTLYTSALALVLGTAFGGAVAIFLSEGFLAQATYRVLRASGLALRPGWSKLPDLLEVTLKNLVSLLAAIPSVVYGLWGLFVVIPLVRPACNWLHLKMGWLPLFGTDLSGPGVLPAVIVLAIMILPTITAISTDALLAVPSKLRMAAYGLGATRWETVLGVIVPTASRGIFGGVVLAFGRALGETMALAMLVGNANQISVSLFSPANTLAALLANAFPEAGPRQVGVLMYAALVLLGITLAVNVIGSILLQRASAAVEGAR
ncbi:MAG TPA: phosphate ABC transporter permease subunit PstC [Anaeromyxobacteraceae bacterium]|nr:phosphate ABC transporter permease subunit PstC [Anaeromyxobacteraceae bacterium]